MRYGFHARARARAQNGSRLALAIAAVCCCCSSPPARSRTTLAIVVAQQHTIPISLSCRRRQPSHLQHECHRVCQQRWWCANRTRTPNVLGDETSTYEDAYEAGTYIVVDVGKSVRTMRAVRSTLLSRVGARPTPDCTRACTMNTAMHLRTRFNRSAALAAVNYVIIARHNNCRPRSASSTEEVALLGVNVGARVISPTTRPGAGARPRRHHSAAPAPCNVAADVLSRVDACCRTSHQPAAKSNNASSDSHSGSMCEHAARGPIARGAEQRASSKTHTTH